jgi:hypothetical protein
VTPPPHPQVMHPQLLKIKFSKPKTQKVAATALPKAPLPPKHPPAFSCLVSFVTC